MKTYLAIKHFIWILLGKGHEFLAKTDDYVESYNYQTLCMLFGMFCAGVFLWILVLRVNEWWNKKE